MHTWSQLEKDLVVWLRNESAACGLTSRGSCDALIGCPCDGFQIDGMVTSDERPTLVALEIEAMQTHPNTSVAEYWQLASEFLKWDKTAVAEDYWKEYKPFWAK